MSLASQKSVIDKLAERLAVNPIDPLGEAAMLASVSNLAWVPNPGPQTDAYYCEADELFYGGQAGGGKTDLIGGLATTVHHRSLLLRRINKDALKLVPRLTEILGSKDGYNGQLQRWNLPAQERLIEIGGCEQEDDKQRYKGDPHDLINFDEITDFTETQYRFIIGWNRSARPGQRCRVLATGNPPTKPEGLWVIKYWAPWLDPMHPNPAKEGELRWFTTIDGRDTEVDGPGPHIIPGEERPVKARSRTFIRASLDDNPDLARTDYDSVLAAMPAELREAYRDGKFNTGLQDDPYQVIPTAWIEAAQQRWTPEGRPKNVAMTAIGLDVSQGGTDPTVAAPRYGGWYAELVRKPGTEVREGRKVASMIVGIRRDRCPVIVDCGGGWGSDALIAMKDNGILCVAYLGVQKTTAKTITGTHGFFNKRACSTWRMREALDPEQEGGSCVAIPPGADIKAQLASYRWWETRVNGIVVIQVEEKAEIKKRLGRSPDDGDAIIMALHDGEVAVEREKRRGQRGGGNPRVTLGYASLKRRQ